MGATPPLVPVFRPVVHKQQDASIRNHIDQQIEQRLGLGVYPVQVLEDEYQRLIEALPQQDAFDRLQGAPPSELWVHLGQRIAGFRNPVQRIQIRQSIL